jgi:hypothetical protein
VRRAFLVGYLRRFGILGTGVRSQSYIGQLLANGAQLAVPDLWSVGLAAAIAAVGAVVPRVLSGAAEHPALGALAIVVRNDAIGLKQSAWAIPACTYVVAGSTAATIDRVRRRIIETAIGVPLGIACLPLAASRSTAALRNAVEFVKSDVNIQFLGCVPKYRFVREMPCKLLESYAAETGATHP